MNQSYLTRLRLATKMAHSNLENLTKADQLMGVMPDKTVYETLLTCHYYFHQEVAYHMRAVSHLLEKPILDWPECRRIDMLKRDASALGLSLHKNFKLNLSDLGVPYAMGLCYVSEGSCLGNIGLYKAMSENEHFISWKADNFLESCTVNTGDRWKCFLERLQPYGEKNYRQVEKGAVDGFNLFKTLWLEHENSSSKVEQ